MFSWVPDGGLQEVSVGAVHWSHHALPQCVVMWHRNAAAKLKHLLLRVQDIAPPSPRTKSNVGWNPNLYWDRPAGRLGDCRSLNGARVLIRYNWKIPGISETLLPFRLDEHSHFA